MAQPHVQLRRPKCPPVPEDQQFFYNSVILVISVAPDQWNYFFRTAVNYARGYGATCVEMWQDDVTRVMVNDDVTWTRLLSRTQPVELQLYVPTVFLSFVWSCIRAKAVLDPVPEADKVLRPTDERSYSIPLHKYKANRARQPDTESLKQQPTKRKRTSGGDTTDDDDDSDDDSAKSDASAESENSPPLLDPGEDGRIAKKNRESATEFLKRLLPTRDLRGNAPRIFVAHPSSPRWPEPETLARLQRSAKRCLSAFARGLLRHDLSGTELGLGGFVRGRWLFLVVAGVDSLWKITVEATLKNDLGCAAEVWRYGRSYNIAIHTLDFGDKDDLKRVFLKARELGLVANRFETTYYKPLIFTELGLHSKDEYGLKVSATDSRSIFKAQR
ncbi:hypothetical protein G647_10421 [Cladophialophora carrionii CBS 160.54]|uniref:Uncharacterized protein n=1 Tax=Cladophialophora carrionii CBS 160.54 TaxID=1279043 RepID=V9DKZ1_9EURO|nr:uncharacterized protein G647_10421 [Cladophialophora carrionii CBS 160.54]ETI26607.1 hypothetical protein G647_10421 [Cladophialophora carrionii CBS 160.54]